MHWKKLYKNEKMKAKKVVIKREKQKKNDLEFVGNAPMLVQIVMGKTLKTIQVYHKILNTFNYKIFHFLCSWNIFKVLTLDFKFHIT